MATTDVRVGAPITGTGGILVGPTTATAPVDATTPTTGLEPAGYVGDEGVTMEQERSVEQIIAWGGDSVRTVQTEHNVTFSWQFIETTEVTLGEVYGPDHVLSDADGFTVEVTSDVLPRRLYVFEMKDGDHRVRVVVPNLQITEVGETNFVHSDVIRYEVTATAFPDQDGVKAYIFAKDGSSEI